MTVGSVSIFNGINYLAYLNYKQYIPENSIWQHMVDIATTGLLFFNTLAAMFLPFFKQLIYVNYLGMHFGTFDWDLLMDILMFLGWIPTYAVAFFYFSVATLKLI